MQSTGRAAVGIILAGFCAAAPAPAQDSRAARKAAMETITAADLKKHLTVIAGDAMRGRNTPSKELAAAATYLAAEFEKGGAKPAAPGGGWLQKKPTPVVAWDAAAIVLSITVNDVPVKLVLGEGVDAAIRSRGPISIEQGKVVAVSMASLMEGDAAESLGSSPIVKGAILLVDVARWTEKRDPLEHLLAKAESVGAAGCLIIEAGRALPDGLREYRRARLEAQQAKRERTASSRAPTIGIAIEDEAVAEHVRARLSAAASKGPHVLEGVTVSVEAKPVESTADVSNVVAMIEPTPGPLAAEAVVFTAHYDHIGIRAPEEGDWISNGADDDGSGTVSLLELAQAFVSLKPAPSRKLVFCAFFGEEKGGLGSKFYAENPAHPMDKTVCDVNIEMIGRSFDVGPKVAWVTGFEYSNLGEILAGGGAEIGVKIIPDPYPRQNYFLRSDNVAFVRARVPGHSVSAGSTHPDYHGVNDEVERIEFENMEQLVRAIFLGSARIADGSHTVRWLKDVPRVR